MQQEWRLRAVASDEGLSWILCGALIVLVLGTMRATYENPQEEVERLASVLTDHDPLSLAPNGEVAQEHIVGFAAQDYESIKENLGLSRDFCIYFEDENGELIFMREDTVGLGSPAIEINKRPCEWG